LEDTKHTTRQTERLPFGSALWNAARRLGLEEEKLFRPLQIDTTRLTLLWMLSDDPGQAMSIYAKRSGMDLATFGRHIDAMVGQELVSKVFDNFDSRKRILELTDQGREALGRQLAHYREFEEDLRRRVGACEFDDLLRLLDLLATRLEPDKG
jgi:DNA-binding MarR family transcriptional regulator